MGSASQAMTLSELINALLYELAIWLVAKYPSLAFSPWLTKLIVWCRPDWTQWKTQQTMKGVDRQTVKIVEQWEKEERIEQAATLAEQAKQLYPNAKITPLPDTVVPSVMIEQEAPEDASDDVKALGGEMRITYQFQELQ
jgi:hypothetical protein